jgi:hypothetical protein
MRHRPTSSGCMVLEAANLAPARLCIPHPMGLWVQASETGGGPTTLRRKGVPIPKHAPRAPTHSARALPRWRRGPASAQPPRDDAPVARVVVSLLHLRDSRRRQPSALIASRQPSALIANRQPSALTANRQPSALTASRQPSALTASRQPSALTANRQPSALTANHKPSALSVLSALAVSRRL